MLLAQCLGPDGKRGIKTKTMIVEGMADNLSSPLFNASYAEQVRKALGPTRADDMVHFYMHDNGVMRSARERRESMASG